MREAGKAELRAGGLLVAMLTGPVCFCNAVEKEPPILVKAVVSPGMRTVPGCPPA